MIISRLPVGSRTLEPGRAARSFSISLRTRKLDLSEFVFRPVHARLAPYAANPYDGPTPVLASANRGTVGAGAPKPVSLSKHTSVLPATSVTTAGRPHHIASTNAKERPS